MSVKFSYSIRVQWRDQLSCNFKATDHFQLKQIEYVLLQESHRPFSHMFRYAGRTKSACRACSYTRAFQEFRACGTRGFCALDSNILPWRGRSVQSFSAFIFGRIGSYQMSLRGVRRWITGRIKMHHSLYSIETRIKCFQIAVYWRVSDLWEVIHGWIGSRSVAFMLMASACCGACLREDCVKLVRYVETVEYIYVWFLNNRDSIGGVNTTARLPDHPSQAQLPQSFEYYLTAYSI